MLNFGETWLRNSKIEFLSYKDVLNAYVGTLNQFSSPVIGLRIPHSCEKVVCHKDDVDGAVVSMLSFYSEDKSLNPAEVYSLFCYIV